MIERVRRATRRTAVAMLPLACLAAVGWIMPPALSAGPIIVQEDTPALSDDSPALSISDARIKEGDAGRRDLWFVVRLSAPVPDWVSVKVTTFDGTATVADSDYVPLNLLLKFPPTTTAESLAVSVIGDSKLETNEWFRVRLSSPSHAVLADSEAIGTIVNDEKATFSARWLAGTDYQVGTLPSAWGDMNGDGYPDLPLFTGGPGKTFNEIPGFRKLLANGNYHGAAWCDYNRDGKLLGVEIIAPCTAKVLDEIEVDDFREFVKRSLPIGFVRGRLPAPQSLVT